MRFRIKKIESRYLKSDFLIELIVSITAGVSAILWGAIFTSESSLLDLRFRTRAAYLEWKDSRDRLAPQTSDRALDERLVMVTVPETVMARTGGAPADRITPRDYLAALVTRIHSFDPAVIALDYTFDRKDSVKNDRQFLSAIKKAGNVIVGCEQVLTIHGYRASVTDTLAKYLESARAGCYLNVIAGADRAVRQYPYMSSTHASLALQAYAGFRQLLPEKQGGAPEDSLRVPPAVKSHLKKKGIDGFLHSPVTINYRKPLRKGFLVLDSETFLAESGFVEEFTRSQIQGKIVIVGDGSFRSDMHKTPFSDSDRDVPPDTPGVLIHATALKNLLDRDFVTETPGAAHAGLILLFVAIAAAASYNFSFLKSVAVSIGAMLLYAAAAFIAFFAWSLWLPITSIIIAIFVTTLLTILFRIAFSEKDNIDAEQSLVRNVSPRVIERCKDLSQESLTASRMAEVVLLVCWPKNIPTVSRSNTTGRIVEFLNFYHRNLKEIIFAFEGAFNSVPLNGAMAFWNAPVGIDDAPGKAIGAAREILDRLSLINRKGAGLFRGQADVSIDIALHAGHVMVGYVGPEGYQDYTVIGEPVNHAFAMAQQFSGDEESWIIATPAFREIAPEGVFYPRKIKAGGDVLYRLKP